jgi:triosephosphate isomerase (TIM)
MRRSMVAANWKMNGRTAEVEALLDALLKFTTGAACEIVICPPSLYLDQAQRMLADSEIYLGAQNIHTADKGAFTGEISALMLKDFSCQFVLVGHSERRELFDESDQFVAEKFASTQAQNLTPILCVGESQAQREAGDTEAVILRQLRAVIESNSIDAFRNAVIAYEPVWAIGTGLTATPEQAQSVHKLIRNTLFALNQEVAESTRILYGGSVKASNAEELFAQHDIDGALVGGASLDAEEFKSICLSA